MATGWKIAEIKWKIKWTARKTAWIAAKIVVTTAVAIIPLVRWVARVVAVKDKVCRTIRRVLAAALDKVRVWVVVIRRVPKAALVGVRA